MKNLLEQRLALDLQTRIRNEGVNSKKGRPLTSETLRKIIRQSLQGMRTQGSVVCTEEQSAPPLNATVTVTGFNQAFDVFVEERLHNHNVVVSKVDS